jgi:hypothetical protein
MGVPAAIRSFTVMQVEHLPAPGFPRNQNGSSQIGLLARKKRQADEHITIPRADLPMMVEVETPVAVAVLAHAGPQAHLPLMRTEERRAQRDTQPLVDREIRAASGSHRLDSKPHQAEPRRDMCLGELMHPCSAHCGADRDGPASRQSLGQEWRPQRRNSPGILKANRYVSCHLSSRRQNTCEAHCTLHSIGRVKRGSQSPKGGRNVYANRWITCR